MFEDPFKRFSKEQKSMRNRMSAILMALLFALVGSVASAQETSGTLTGKLTDTQGLAVPGA
ncbi:MAG TPA: hypothetical protein VFZ38_18695, partial [Vicinamibacterales bacterium]